MTAVCHLDRTAQGGRESRPGPGGTELADAEAQLVALHGIGPVRQLAIEVRVSPPSQHAQPDPAE
jgi:hypothetical protein